MPPQDVTDAAPVASDVVVEENSQNQTVQQAELKIATRLTSWLVLEISSSDIETLLQAAKAEMAKAPQLFQGAPVALDFNSALASDNSILTPEWLASLLTALSAACFSVLAIVAEEKHRKLAETAGLLLLAPATARPAAKKAPAGKAEAGKPARVADETGAEPADNASQQQTLVVNRPVRSGQQVYAKGRDLILMAQVSAGAEVIADGNIHCYAPLRGRAIAGASGNGEAKLFCSDLSAELVAVAGTYLTADEMGDAYRNKAVVIGLVGEQLDVQLL